jgi:hypothetical protein
MVDADSNEKTDWKTKYDQIVDGFSRINNGVIGVPCVPMSASESWLLADPDVWKKLGLNDLRMLPDRPEHIWGERHCPDGNHPHPYFARVCREAGVEDNASTRNEIAVISSIEILARACPTSFATFITDMGALS